MSRSLLRAPGRGELVRGPGLGLAAASVGFTLVAGAVVVASATALETLVFRLELVTVVILVLGLGLGASRIVALASIPALTAAGYAFLSRPELLWGRSLIVACLWYLAVEAGLASIRARAGVDHSPAVARALLNEAATVLALTVVVGMGTVLVGFGAPERTLLLRSVAFGGLVILLIVAVRHLRTATDRVEPT